MHLSQLQRQAWKCAEAKGHHLALKGVDPRYAALIRLGLVHTEVSEAMQEVKRHGVDTAFIRTKIGNELADICIRVAELAETLGINLQEHTAQVLRQNWLRPYQYGTPGEEQA